MKWLFDSDNPLFLRVITSESFDLSDQQRMLEEINELVTWKDGKPILFDHCKLDMRAVNSTTLMESVETFLKFTAQNSQTRIAGLVGTTLNFGLGRQFGTFHEIGGGGNRFRIFASENEAVDWLTTQTYDY